MAAACGIGGRASDQRSVAPGPRDADSVAFAQEPGTIQTVAGPGFCPAGNVRDPSSEDLRGLAVGPKGNLFAQIGNPSDGKVAKVDASGETTVLRTGIVSTAGGLIASDGHGGALIGGERQVVHLDNGVTSITGRPSSAPAYEQADEPDGGPAVDAGYHRIKSIASDKTGNLYIADGRDSRSLVAVRVVNRGSQPLTFYPATAFQTVIQPRSVGTIAGGKAPQGQASSDAAIMTPLTASTISMAVGMGKLYLAVNMPKTRSTVATSFIRMINLGGQALWAHGRRVGPGQIETIAGGLAGFGGDGGDAAKARFSNLSAIAADFNGNLYAADRDNNRIRKIDAGGLVSTIAGGGEAGFNGNERRAIRALLDHPYGIGSAPDGRIFFSDRGNKQLRYIDPGGVIHAAPGNGSAFSTLCRNSRSARESPEEAAVPGRPTQVASTPRGAAFFAAPGLGAVQGIGALGSSVSKILGKSLCISDVCRRHAAGISFQSQAAVTAMTLDSGGGIYVAYSDGVLRYFNTRPRAIRRHGMRINPHTAADVADHLNDRVYSHGASIPAEDSQVKFMAADKSGALYLTGWRRLARIDARGTVTNLSANPGPGTAGCCINPTGLAVDGSGNLFVADSRGHKIWILNTGRQALLIHGHRVPAGHFEVLAGTGKAGFEGDGGPAVAANLLSPQGLAVDGRGSLFLADDAEHTIRRIDTGGMITTSAGIGTRGFNGDGLAGALTALNSPSGLAIDSCGDLLFADTGNDRIRRLKLHPRCIQSL